MLSEETVVTLGAFLALLQAFNGRTFIIAEKSILLITHITENRVRLYSVQEIISITSLTWYRMTHTSIIPARFLTTLFMNLCSGSS